jgi:hypothetical protein
MLICIMDGHKCESDDVFFLGSYFTTLNKNGRTRTYDVPHMGEIYSTV